MTSIDGLYGLEAAKLSRSFFSKDLAKQGYVAFMVWCVPLDYLQDIGVLAIGISDVLFSA